MEQKRIDEKMREFEKQLGYEFNDISHLAKAMYSQRLPKSEHDGKNNHEYSNESLAFLGDTIIKLLIAEYLYDNGKEKRKGQMTKEKSALEKNQVFHDIITKENLIAYACNDKHFYTDDAPQHEKVCCKKHDPYIEAITAAIYLDCKQKISTMRKWFKTWLLPKLEKYKNNTKQA